MNKKILMLAPFMGLLLTSCNKGPNWKVITKEEALEIRNAIVPDYFTYEIPKRVKATYSSGQFVAMGETIKCKTKYAYDYEKMFWGEFETGIDIQTGNLVARQVYYLPKIDEDENCIYNLTYDENGNKIVLKYTGEGNTAREQFNTLTNALIRAPLLEYWGQEVWLNGFTYYGEMCEEAAKTDPEHYKGVVKYSSYDENSLKVYAYSYVKQDNKNLQETKGELVIENGFISKLTENQSVKIDGQAMTVKKGALTYKTNCEITIPEEANIETWGK